MKQDKLKSKLEVYVCAHERSDSESCGQKGAKELTDKLKKWSKEKHQGEIKVIRSGCLGKCSEGIALACYPEKKLLLKVEPGDYAKITEELEEALGKLS